MSDNVENAPADLLPGQIGELMSTLGSTVRQITQLDPGDLDGAGATSLLLALRAWTGQLDAVAATVLPIVEATGSWAAEGWRSFAPWLAFNERISVGAARKQVRLSRALRDELPGTARAAVTGDISLEHAHVLTTLAATSDRRRECLAAPDEPRSPVEQVCNERFLLDQARDLPVDQFRTLVRRWAAAADPDACERGFARAQDREYFELAHTLDGYHVTGFLTVEHALGLQAALNAVAGVPPKDDVRSRGQRQAHALGDLARLCLDQGLAAVLATLACDSTINRIIFGAQSAIIDVGRQERTFTGTKRHAVIARDRHCQYPGCAAPPALCEIHHRDHWVRDHGKTSVATGILLCWRHHHHVHDTSIEIHRTKNGEWVFTRADGTTL